MDSPDTTLLYIDSVIFIGVGAISLFLLSLLLSARFSDMIVLLPGFALQMTKAEYDMLSSYRRMTHEEMLALTRGDIRREPD